MRLLAAIMTLVNVSAAFAAAAPRSPFESASLAPSDVRVFIQINDGAAIRRHIVNRPIAEWATGLLAQGEFSKAWGRLAQRAKIDEGRLFDQLLGRRVTLIARSANEWALITDIEASRTSKLLERLNARVRLGHHGLAMFDVPEHDLAFGVDEHRTIIGPASHQALFRSVIGRLRVEQRHSLATQSMMERAAELGPGNIAVFMRHEPPLGGWSMMVADLHGSTLNLKHAADFDNPPFTHGITKLSCDFSPVNRFDKNALAAIIEPTDVSDGPLESFVAATLRQPLISKDMRANLGERKMLIVGEQEMRELSEPVDLLGTTFVKCIELKDKDIAVAHLDAHMIKLCEHINKLCAGSMLTDAPDVATLKPDQPREVDLSPAAQWFTGGFPVMKNLTLTWRVADGPNGAWYMIGTHRRSLEDVAGVLCQPCPTEPAMVGKFQSCGVVNGQRVSRHLQSWCSQAEQLAPEGQAEALRQPLQAFSQLSAGIKDCRWQLARPSANQMRLNVQIELAPPLSTSD